MPFMLDIHSHRSAFSGQQGIYNMDLRTLVDGPIQHHQVSLGLHPWYFTEEDMESQLKILESHLDDRRVLMIGECGFDRLRGPVLSLQKEAFNRQVNLAMKFEKPLIIHCVKAFDELIACKKQVGNSVPMIIHGFNKSAMLGRQLLAHGFLFSFGEAIMREGSPASQFLKEIEEPFFLETDDSPLSISDLYRRASFLRNISVMELKDVIFAGWEKIGLINYG